MEIVRAKEITIPAFGMFINRDISIKCGECNNTFKDKPARARRMLSKCPYCNTINELPITENR